MKKMKYTLHTQSAGTLQFSQPEYPYIHVEMDDGHTDSLRICRGGALGFGAEWGWKPVGNSFMCRKAKKFQSGTEADFIRICRQWWRAYRAHAKSLGVHPIQLWNSFVGDVTILY